MRLSFITSIVTIAFFAGCGDGHSHSQDSHDSAKSHSDAVSSAISKTLDIKLNHGKKWVTDEHTRDSFAEMSDAVSSDLSGKPLGASLQSSIQTLITGCSLQGEAHDHLHTYLMKLMPEIKELEKTGSPTAEAKITVLLELYGEFFE